MNVRAYIQHYFDIGNNKKVRNICSKLGDIPFYKNFSTNQIIKKIENRFRNLDNKLESRTLKYLRMKEGCEVIQELKKIVFTGEVDHNQYTMILNEWGFLFNNEIPDDTRLSLIKIWKNEIVIKFQNPAKPYNPSLFLKYILFIGFCYQNNNLKREVVQRKLGLDKETLNNLITFGRSKNHLVENEGIIILKTKVVYCWLENDELKHIKEFYNWFITKKSYNKFAKILKEISNIQATEKEWIDYNKIVNLFEITPIRYLENSFGLLASIKINNKRYIQLSTEGWFITKEIDPLLWKKDTFNSDDRCIYIPYYYNPFIISKILKNSTLEANEYLIVLKQENKNESSSLKIMD